MKNINLISSPRVPFPTPAEADLLGQPHQGEAGALHRRPTGGRGTGNSAAARREEGRVDRLVGGVGTGGRLGAAEGLQGRRWGRVGRERGDGRLVLLGVG